MKRICHGGVTRNVLQRLHSQRQDLLLSQLGCPLSLWQDPWLKAQVCGQGQLQHGTSGHRAAGQSCTGRQEPRPARGWWEKWCGGSRALHGSLPRVPDARTLRFVAHSSLPSLDVPCHQAHSSLTASETLSPMQSLVLGLR